MKKDFKGKSKRGGIYQIQNCQNGKIYIGSAKCFQVRASQHQTQLRNQKHRNKHLQASFEKHGEDNFLFEVLEVIEGDKLARTTREEEFLQEQIKLGNWDNCFNFLKRTKTNPKKVWSSSPEETIERIRQGNLGKKVTVETRQRMSKAHEGQRHSMATRSKLAKIARKQWENKTAEEKEQIALTFSKANKGRKYSKSHIENIRKANLGNAHRAKEFKLFSPDGNLVLGKNIKEFAVQNSLNPAHLCAILNGKRKSHKGWKIFK